MLRCGCLKVRKDPLRFHPRSPNFQRFHISKCFANYYPASRGPSVFPIYLGRSKGPCSRGTCKLAKHLPRMGVVPCEQCLWGYGVAEELKCLEFFTGVQAQCMSIFPLYMYIVKLIGDRKSNKQMQFFSMYAWTCTNMDYPCRPSPWTPSWTQSMDYPCGPPYLLKMNFTSWPEYDTYNNVGQGGYYPSKANFALSLYCQAYELLILYTHSVFS